MARLQRVRGHFLNWYDTRDLRPLEPRYVSTVDSGNLAGHLIALANACREWSDHPLDLAQRFSGVADALDITRAECARLHDGRKTQTVTLHQLDDALAAVASALQQGLAFASRVSRRSSTTFALTQRSWSTSLARSLSNVATA